MNYEIDFTLDRLLLREEGFPENDLILLIWLDFFSLGIGELLLIF